MSRQVRCTNQSWFVLIELVGLLSVAGCVSKGVAPAGATDVSGAMLADYWCPEPVQMRVYPSTRFVRRDGATVLEARVELFDQMADSVKSSGNFYFELYQTNTKDGAPKRVYTWHVTVQALEHQRTFYEPITRAYLFPLALRDDWSPRRTAKLRVLFTPPQGTRLETMAVLDADLSDHRPPPATADDQGARMVTPDPHRAHDEPR